jgi:hypothetical protein
MSMNVGVGPGIPGRSGGSGRLASAGDILNNISTTGPGAMGGGMGGVGGGGASGSTLPSLKASGLLDSWVPPIGNGRSSPSQSRLPTPPWIALMAQSAANAAPHASQNATVTITASIAEATPSDTSSKFGLVGGAGSEAGGLAQRPGQGHGFGVGIGSGQQHYGMEDVVIGGMEKGVHDEQGQGISGGMVATESAGLGGAGGKSTMPVGLPWLKDERPR